MSVIMILKLKADAGALERFANANTDLMAGIEKAGRELGAIRHAFAAADGEVLVIDEWPDEAAFHTFFAGQPDIKQVMQAAGAEGPPEITFYRKLDAPGQF